jgi:excinuclease UvrABC nuclease subunit
VPDLNNLFQNRAAAADVATLPAKWCVALLTGPQDKPIQLLCTKNLRRSVLKRLTPDEEGARTKRADLTQIVESVWFTRVDGMLEMELLYQRVAVHVFPHSWQKVVPDRPCYFVQVDVDSPHPNYHRLDRLPASSRGHVIGPFLTRSNADDCVDAMRDAFDLCRQHDLLRQTPNARACAYKQMNKCPAPCDGTVSMDIYRDNVRHSLQVFQDVDAIIHRWNNQMHQHAQSLRFEQAGQIKQRIESVQKWSTAKPFTDFRSIVIDRGSNKPDLKLFVVRGVEVIPAHDIETASQLFSGPVVWPDDEAAHRRLGMLAHWLDDSAPAVVLDDPSQLHDAIEPASQQLWPAKPRKTSTSKPAGNDHDDEPDELRDIQVG